MYRITRNTYHILYICLYSSHFITDLKGENTLVGCWIQILERWLENIMYY